MSTKESIATAIMGDKVWYSVSDICSMLSVPPMKFHEWVNSNDRMLVFPKPTIFVAEMPMWVNSVIQEWLAQNIDMNMYEVETVPESSLHSLDKAIGIVKERLATIGMTKI